MQIQKVKQRPATEEIMRMAEQDDLRKTSDCCYAKGSLSVWHKNNIKNAAQQTFVVKTAEHEAYRQDFSHTILSVGGWKKLRSKEEVS